MIPVRLNFSTAQLLNIILVFLLFGCAGSSHPRLITPSEGPSSPRYLEIYSNRRVATLHFPAGVYTLNAVDKIGYYYRAPGKIAEHFGGGSFWREGGIFVSKRNPQKLRGYVFRAGTITMSATSQGQNIAFASKTSPPSSDLRPASCSKPANEHGKRSGGAISKGVGSGGNPCRFATRFGLSLSPFVRGSA